MGILANDTALFLTRAVEEVQISLCFASSVTAKVAKPEINQLIILFYLSVE